MSANHCDHDPRSREYVRTALYAAGLDGDRYADDPDAALQPGEVLTAGGQVTTEGMAEIMGAVILGRGRQRPGHPVMPVFVRKPRKGKRKRK